MLIIFIFLILIIHVELFSTFLDESSESQCKIWKRKQTKTLSIQLRLFIFHKAACLQKYFHGRVLSILNYFLDSFNDCFIPSLDWLIYFAVQYCNNSSKERAEFFKKFYTSQTRRSSNVVYIIQYCLFIFKLSSLLLQNFWILPYTCKIWILFLNKVLYWFFTIHPGIFRGRAQFKQ